jgi:nitrous oxide reductase accessory protein NosL
VNGEASRRREAFVTGPKKIFAGLLAAFLLCLCGTPAPAQEDIDRHGECGNCGMSRKAYGYSRMLLRYRDGSESGVCSVHCAAVKLAASGERSPKSILVADRDTRELTDAETATWVMGGRKRGVMTRRPKWAFASRAAAEAFVREHGGEIVSWPEALAAAREESGTKPR